MIAYLDPILFPDECHVYELDGRYVYPIFKNGSSSLTRKARLVTPSELEQADTVDVYLREPFERYVSGVQTYLEHNPGYDRSTSLQFISNFLFLNRHFALQFHWLMNFTRFSDAKFNFKTVNEIPTVARNTSLKDNSIAEYFMDNKKLHFYLELDKTLFYDNMHKTVSMKEVIEQIKTTKMPVYTEIIQRSLTLCSALD